MQDVMDGLVLGELELAGHVRHTTTVVAPTVVEYMFTPQLVHARVPVVILYFPAAHAVHGPPVGPVKPALQSTIQAALDELATGEIKAGLVHVVQSAVPVVSL